MPFATAESTRRRIRSIRADSEGSTKRRRISAALEAIEPLFVESRMTKPQILDSLNRFVDGRLTDAADHIPVRSAPSTGAIFSKMVLELAVDGALDLEPWALEHISDTIRPVGAAELPGSSRTALVPSAPSFLKARKTLGAVESPVGAGI